jgi:hypothetical protein
MLGEAMRWSAAFLICTKTLKLRSTGEISSTSFSREVREGREKEEC